VTVPPAIRTPTEVEALRTGLVLAMERLCFASAERFSDELPADEAVHALVAFRGQTSGAVAIAIPLAAMRGFVTALLLPEATEDQLVRADLVSEIANIVCGNVVPRIFGRNSVYVLSPPELARLTGKPLATAVVHFEIGWAAAMLYRDL
jgi:CheY-specific phosphatase CheX